ncbi:MAG: hypothetical protein ACLP9L_21865 [Thermoguttaceae bacterium]
MIVAACTSMSLRHPARVLDPWFLISTILVVANLACQIGMGAAGPVPARLTYPMVVTQLSLSHGPNTDQRPSIGRYWPDDQPSRLVLVFPDSSTRLLSDGFYSASDPEVSFDAARVLFTGKRRAGENSNIYEATLDGRNLRQITKDLGDCRSPCYQGTLYTLDSPAPWHEITFVSSRGGVWNEYGSARLTNLYSCKPDGSTVRRLTFNLSNDADPCLLGDGRLIFMSWQRCTLERGRLGYAGLFAVNLDGTDYSLFAENRGKQIRRMPCVTTKGLVVFVQSDEASRDGAGTLASITLRRPLHSYRPITKESDGRFRSPSPLPDGQILVCRRTADGKGMYGVYCLNPVSGEYASVFRDPRFHSIEAKLVRPRAEPDGRSSNVQEDDPRGKFYCLDVYTSDLEGPGGMMRGMAKRLRIMEGVPWKVDGARRLAGPQNRTSGLQGTAATVGTMALRRVLGEVAVEEDGSFNIAVPANTPIQLQLLDDRGMALRSCAWIWARNHESRGCIGCHEDGELVPEDRFAKALGKSSIVVSSASAQRQAPDFRRDLLPIVRNKCLDCHRQGQSPPFLAEVSSPAEVERTAHQVYEQLLASAEASASQSADGKYVHPGRARTSPLAWHILGQNTSKPWDAAARQRAWKPIPSSAKISLTEDDKQAFVEWIDAGAAWDSRPAMRDAEDKRTAGEGGVKERGGM